MSEMDEKRRRELAKLRAITNTIPGPKNDGFAASVFASVAELYATVDDEDVRQLVTKFDFGMTFSLKGLNPTAPEELKQSDWWKKWSIGVRLLRLPEHDRKQAIEYLERQRYSYQPPKPPAKGLSRLWSRTPAAQTYQLKWNGRDDFDILRVQ